jgi:glycosyltransferase 2 family protein
MALKRYLLFVVGIALTFLVLSYFGFDDTISVLQHTRVEFLFAAVALQFVIFGLLVVRLKLLTHGKGFVSTAQISRVTLSGMFVNMVTPFAKLGGEPLKMYMLRSNIGNYSASAAIAIESIMELLSSFFVVIAVALFFFNDIPAAYISTFLIFLVVITFALGILFKIIFTTRWLNRLINWFATKAAKMVESEKRDYAQLFSTAFYSMWKNKQVVWGSFSVSVLMKLVEILRFWLIFQAFDLVLPLKTAVIVWTILLVVMFIPWLPGSLGLAEFGGISALIVFGITKQIAASAMVLDRLVSFWLPLFVGMVAFSIARKKGELPNIAWKKKNTTPASKKPIEKSFKNSHR